MMVWLSVNILSCTVFKLGSQSMYVAEESKDAAMNNIIIC